MKLNKEEIRRLSEAEETLVQLYWYMFEIQEDKMLMKRVDRLVGKIQELKEIGE